MSDVQNLQNNNILLNNIQNKITNMIVQVNNLPNYINTYTADASPSDIMYGKTAFVNGTQVVGTMTEYPKLKWVVPDGIKIGPIMYSNIDDLDVEQWDVGNVTNLSYFFNNCTNLLGISNMNKWDVSNVTNTYHMLNQARYMNNIDISSWNLSKTVNGAYMFTQMYNLVSINLEGVNLPIVEDIRQMFSYCNNLNDASVDSIINMCLNATNVIVKDLTTSNGFSPFCYTNITNDRYQNRWIELTQAGWTY